MRRVLTALVVLAACTPPDDGAPVDSDAVDSDVADETDATTDTDDTDETDTPPPPDPDPMEVTLAPEAPVTGEALTCSASPASGADVAWRWFKNDVGADIREATVPEGTTKAYERWTCMGTSLDGLYEGEATVTIEETCQSLQSVDATTLLRVDTAGRPALAAVDQPFTVEAWVWHTGATARQDLVRLTGVFDPSRVALMLSLEDDELVFRTDGAGDDDCAALAAPAPAADGWHHVSASWEPTQGIKQLHVDGEAVATCESTARPPAPVTGFLTIGGAVVVDATPVQNVFQGWIDELRLSSTERYIGSFTPPLWYEPDADTLLLFHMNELIEVTLPTGDHEAVPDESGNGFHALVVDDFPGLSSEHAACELRP